MCAPKIQAFLKDLLTSWDLDHLQQQMPRAYEFDNVNDAYYKIDSAKTGFLVTDRQFFMLSG